MNKFIVIVFFIFLILFSCKKEKSKSLTTDLINKNINDSDNKNTKSFLTFIELGSVSCIPCKMMQPVMRKIEENYKEKVKVIFYDVWTEKDKNMVNVYKIRVIPTQVFLDKKGKEYFRHEGYFPYEEVEKTIKKKL